MKKQPAIEARSNPISRNTPETLRYFYHPDHIGSTSWVTDSAKNGIQYCEYLPYKKLRFFSSLAFGNEKQVFHYAHCLCRFGEPFLDQRSTTWNSRYTFSGKERDGETGYSYFGARYYNSDISIWLSVDPLSDKYPSLSPYVYCLNNPIRWDDPDGRDPGDPFKSPYEAAVDWGNYYNGASILRGKEFGSTIYQYTSNETTYYSYTVANEGTNDGVSVCLPQNGEEIVADIHSHGKYESQYKNNEFSPEDMMNNHENEYDGYLTTPNGTLQKYDHGTKETSTLKTDLQSDPNDPQRQNKSDPIDIPNQKNESNNTTTPTNNNNNQPKQEIEN